MIKTEETHKECVGSMSLASSKKRKRVHVCVLGDAGAGKSALVTSFCMDRSPTSRGEHPFRKPAKTFVMDSAAKRIELNEADDDRNDTEKVSIEMCITDFSGNDCYKDARYATYDDSGRDIDAFLIVVANNRGRDVHKSLRSVQSRWFEEITRYVNSKNRQKQRRSFPPCVCLCFHDVETDGKNTQPDDAFLERALDALDAFDQRLAAVASSSFSSSSSSSKELFERSNINTSSAVNIVKVPPEFASFVATANAKTGANVRAVFQRLAKRALERRSRDRKSE
jgi:GTPase SAR1 family protein